MKRRKKLRAEVFALNIKHMYHTQGKLIEERSSEKFTAFYWNIFLFSLSEVYLFLFMCSSWIPVMRYNDKASVVKPLYSVGKWNRIWTGGAVGWGTALQAGRSRVRIDGFSGIFHWFNSSGPTVALGSTQPLAEMSTRGVKAAGAYDWQPCYFLVPID
jgi:hypothetical protein